MISKPDTPFVRHKHHQRNMSRLATGVDRMEERWEMNIFGTTNGIHPPEIMEGGVDEGNDTFETGDVRRRRKVGGGNDGLPKTLMVMTLRAGITHTRARGCLPWQH